MVRDNVIVLSNDVTPGSGVPVAAPGLRAFGFAEGLRAHGFHVTTVVPKHLLDRVWNQTSPPPPHQPGVVALNGGDLAAYIESNAPATVVMTNSNQVAHLHRHPDIRYVLDIFAPKMLELAYQYGDRHHPADALRALRSAKLDAYNLADGVVVNGSKKLAYVLAWMLQTDRDPRSVPMIIANMGVPGVDHVETSEGVRYAIAGYLQGWSLPGEWLDTVVAHLQNHGDTQLDVVLPEHWGKQGSALRSERLEGLLALPNATTHPAMRFVDFQALLAQVDVVVDLFDWSLEREYAMVTRTVVALACGVPVIHPPFTEVAPFIARYDAGWLIDASDVSGLAKLLEEIDARSAHTKATNALQLWREVFEPSVATQAMAEMIRGFWTRP